MPSERAVQDLDKASAPKSWNRNANTIRRRLLSVNHARHKSSRRSNHDHHVSFGLTSSKYKKHSNRPHFMASRLFNSSSISLSQSLQVIKRFHAVSFAVPSFNHASSSLKRTQKQGLRCFLSGGPRSPGAASVQVLAAPSPAPRASL